jgi:spore germination cell wall hydrolase CwlJ-like protein
LTTKTQARAPVRALVGAAAFGSLVGLAMGCAYLGGSMAKAMTVRAKAERLADAADAGYSNVSLAQASGADASALSIARAHDPYTVAGGAQRDRQAVAFAARLERDEPVAAPAAGGLRKASFTLSPAAKPFRMAALDASRDLDCLSQAVYYEARGEGVAGMRAVAQVVLNRARHPAFPKTICGVVFQGSGQRIGCQFSFTCDGSMRRGVQQGAWRRARAIAGEALSGYVMGEVGNATHFHTTGVAPGWRSNMIRVAQVGTHLFYRFGGRNGDAGAFRYQAKPSTEMDSFKPVMAGFAPALPEGPAPYEILFKGLPGVGDKAEAKPEPKPHPLAADKPEPAKAEAPAAEAPKADAAAPAAPQ